MKVHTVVGFNGIVLFEPTIFTDERGSFHESYRETIFDEAIGEKVRFVQENQSVSHMDVFRGFHFQFGDMAQAKLVKVAKGAATDVVLDLRRDQPSYGKVYAEFLSEEMGNMMYIPAGFAHGFVSMMEGTIFQYKCTNYYSKAHEGGINPVPYIPEFWKVNDRDKSFPTMKDYLEIYQGKVNF